MDEKQTILEAILPLAALKAMTPEAKKAVPQPSLIAGVVSIRAFPFRVGRESRIRKVNGKWERIERAKLDNRNPSNELYLVDEGHLLNISREHFQIERDGEGFTLFDRGSACGTWVGETSVGGNDAIGRMRLKDGDIIAIGSKTSPYIFQFITLNEYEIRHR